MYTNGPWVAEGLGRGEHDVHIIARDDSGKLLNDTHSVAITFGPDKDDNARLIAAAPYLLEALEDAASAIMSIDKELFGRDDIHDGYYYRDELMDRINKAIAMAKESA